RPFSRDTDSKQPSGDVARLAACHIQHGGIGIQRCARPVMAMLAAADRRREETYAATQATLGQGLLQGSRSTKRRTDARHHAYRDAGLRQALYFFLRPPEKHRVAALEPDHHAIPV